MKVNRRTQAERTAATRAALIAAGRKLFGERGFADVGTQEIVDEAGVTRGALYHQFDDKKGLFTAVYDAVEQDVVTQIAERSAELAADNPIAALKSGMRLFLELCTEPSVHRITLVEAPSVLGWAQWRARGEEFGFALVERLIQAAIAAGQAVDQPTRPLAHVAIGALDEAALYVAAAQDRDAATAEVAAVLDRIVDSFRS
ncbi:MULTISPECIES: TetR/AcrR family transcriptional regulator [Gordonia]|jgi:AcrR family transcriptional regulator|uniref:TetR family transcriptional regulator n=1 Tax=Gordonia alkanivorans CGMCC 6845 TaxID=1423140 RepID=W9DBW2_9ACTN|nr:MULTISPECIES: TetR/AcrR family transcriptional regulator [Gordonia]ETA05844.1 TetR family transcriptional regulator [Gordonia alkanivorans CGMCC 6845]MDH3005867.1 TetR/AcrR family transcriptional regulator [Gordonia alkanivorans]MDH3019732.1 TetR/AcrR family transcriptional regulator [Gordonia alkanivorans]MDH3051510.1 TetR/AcrR family transcriptional regulator [Gordonia alkanivorans]MDJ0008368.1 TetR/AcrR family transcriptional regulator [Gordonia alkanivorans]